MSTEELLTKAQEILNKVKLPDRHSFFQLEKFVIGKEPTGNAQVWQIVRELDARHETVDAYKKDLADAEDNLELFDLRIERVDIEIRELAKLDLEEPSVRDLDIKEREINIRKLKREKEALIKASQKVKKKFEYVLEEMNFLVSAFDSVVAHLGNDIKPLDDREAQQEMWNEKLLEEFNLRILLQRPLDPELVRTIMCLPDGSSAKGHLTKMLEAKQQQMMEMGAKQKKLVQPQVEPKARVSS
jgi:DNA repair exonuclease SbcCD ATPase subunit